MTWNFLKKFREKNNGTIQEIFKHFGRKIYNVSGTNKKDRKLSIEGKKQLIIEKFTKKILM